MKKSLIFIIPIFLSLFSFIFTQNPCILSSTTPPSCLSCSFDHYDAYLEEKTLSNTSQSLNFSDCVPKINLISFKKILIYNSNIAIESSYFNAKYRNLFDAFFFESLQANIYTQSNLTFYIAKGSHFLIKPHYIYRKISFFDKMKVDILIKPLFCSEFNDENLCVLDVFPTIFFKYGLFSITISFKLEINAINFNMIDLRNSDFSENSCIFQQFSCCNHTSIKDNSSSCYISSNNPLSFSSKASNGLFEIKAIDDDPNYIVPIVNFTKINFFDMYFNEIDSIYFGSFIVMNEFGGQLKIVNLSIIGLQIQGYIFANYQNAQNTGFKPITTQKIHFENFKIQNDHFLTKNSFSGFLCFFYIAFFKGEVFFTNITIANLNYEENSKVFLYYFKELSQGVSLKNLYFVNITGISLFYVSTINFTISQFLIENYL